MRSPRRFPRRLHRPGPALSARRTPTILAAAVIAGTTAALAGCGSGDGGAATGTPEAQPAAPATATPGEAGAASGVREPTAGPPPAGDDVAAARRAQLAEAERGVAEAPEDASAHLRLGRALTAIGRWEESEAPFRKALELDPGLREAQADLGLVLLRLGQGDEGIALLEAQAGAQADDVDAQLRLALAYRAVGRPEDAVAALDRTLQLDDEHTRARFERAVLWAEQGRLDDAVTEFERVVAERPDLPAGYVNLARAHLRSGRTAKALDVYRLGITKFPEHDDIQATLAWLLATNPDDTLRDGQEAVDNANRLCARDRYRNPLYLDILAAASAERGDFDVAVHYATKALDIYLHPAGPGTEGEFEEHIKRLQTRIGLYRDNKAYHQPVYVHGAAASPLDEGTPGDAEAGPGAGDDVTDDDHAGHDHEGG